MDEPRLLNETTFWTLVSARRFCITRLILGLHEHHPAVHPIIWVGWAIYHRLRLSICTCIRIYIYVPIPVYPCKEYVFLSIHPESINQVTASALYLFTSQPYHCSCEARSSAATDVT